MIKISQDRQEALVKEWKACRSPTIDGFAYKFNLDERTLKKILRIYNITWSSSHIPLQFRQLNVLHNDIRSILKDIYGNILDNKAYKHIKLPAKVLYFDDEHIPFLNVDCIDTMLRLDGDADGYVTGEIINFDAFAVYIKNYISNPLKEDEIAGQLTKILTHRFKWGFTLDTNHTRRLDKFLARTSDAIQLDYFRKTFQGVLPSFTRISKKVRYVGQPVLQLGKALFCHFDSFSSTYGKTVEWMEENMMNWADCYGAKDFDSVWVGHTHNQELHYRYGRLLAEVGCTCYAQDYLFRGKVTAAHRKFRWVNGYGVIYLNKDGSTDFQKSHLQFLGFAGLPAMEKST